MLEPGAGLVSAIFAGWDGPVVTRAVLAATAVVAGVFERGFASGAVDAVARAGGGATTVLVGAETAAMRSVLSRNSSSPRIAYIAARDGRVLAATAVGRSLLPPTLRPVAYNE